MSSYVTVVVLAGVILNNQDVGDSNEVVIIDNDPDVSSGTSTGHENERTCHEEYENDDNDYSNEDRGQVLTLCSLCLSSHGAVTASRQLLVVDKAMQ